MESFIESNCSKAENMDLEESKGYFKAIKRVQPDEFEQWILEMRVEKNKEIESIVKRKYRR